MNDGVWFIVGEATWPCASKTPNSTVLLLEIEIHTVFGEFP